MRIILKNTDHLTYRMINVADGGSLTHDQKRKLNCYMNHGFCGCRGFHPADKKIHIVPDGTGGLIVKIDK